MKKNLEILEIEAKLTKDEKKYWRVKTGQGWMSVFDVVAKDAIKETHNHSDNGMVCCEVIEKKGTDFKGEEKIFYNITKCYGEPAVDEELAQDEKPEVVKIPSQDQRDISNQICGYKEGIKASKPNGQASMYTAYAKDLYKENRDMALTKEECVEVIQYFKEAFE